MKAAQNKSARETTGITYAERPIEVIGQSCADSGSGDSAQKLKSTRARSSPNRSGARLLAQVVTQVFSFFHVAEWLAPDRLTSKGLR